MAREAGLKVGQLHLRNMNPLPNDLGEILKRYKRVLVPELNLGQLSQILRARYLVDASPSPRSRASRSRRARFSTPSRPCWRSTEMRVYPEVTHTDPSTLKLKDFQSDQDVRWCPGCGDYSILANVQRAMPGLGIPKENFVFVSGIGCSSRFPYYMNTYGMHTIHGRAPAVATGIKSARPDLSVWVITGDGDALSIGGNHFLHVLRRNVDIKYMLFNNRIYGLTKGQYSPTSELGKKTKSHAARLHRLPDRSGQHGARRRAPRSWRARSTSTRRASRRCWPRQPTHKGTAFIEIYQNCNIFNDGAFVQIQDKKSRPGQRAGARARQAHALRREEREGHRARRARAAAGGRRGHRGRGQAACSRRDQRHPAVRDQPHEAAALPDAAGRDPQGAGRVVRRHAQRPGRPRRPASARACKSC